MQKLHGNELQRGITQSLYNQSLRTIVSHKAKKKQAVRNERMSYLHIAPL